MPVPGRKSSKCVGRYFTEENAEKCCIFCHWKTKAGTGRLLDHLLTCRRAPETATNEVRAERGILKPKSVPTPTLALPFVSDRIETAAQSLEPITSPVAISSSGQIHEPPSCSSAFVNDKQCAPAKTNSLTSFVKTMSSTEMEELHLLLGRAIYTSGASFSLVENSH